MAAILQFNPDSIPVAGMVTGYIPIADTLQFLSADGVTPVSGALINPVLPKGVALANLCVQGGVVRPLTPDEIASVADAVSADAAAALQAQVASIMNAPASPLEVLVVSALAYLLDQINGVTAPIATPIGVHGATPVKTALVSVDAVAGIMDKVSALTP